MERIYRIKKTKTERQYEERNESEPRENAPENKKVEW